MLETLSHADHVKKEEEKIKKNKDYILLINYTINLIKRNEKKKNVYKLTHTYFESNFYSGRFCIKNEMKHITMIHRVLISFFVLVNILL